MRFIAALLGLCALGAAPQQPDVPAIHDDAIVLDTHLDTPANLGRPGWSILDRHPTEEEGDQVDLPRLAEGGVDGGWWVIFTAQGPRDEAGLRAARDHALNRLTLIREMAGRHDHAFELAITAADAQRIEDAGRRIVYISMENSSPVETDLGLMRTFRSLGVTMMGPVHFRNNGLADSGTDAPEWNGLSPKGREFVAEANRLGIVIDASHASDDATRQMVELSAAPIILSHSGMRAIYDHPRNISDADARLVAAKGGVIQINAFNGYMIANPPNAERDAALRALMAEAGPGDLLTPERKRELTRRRAAIDAQFPQARATFDDVMKHIFHAIELVGVDHVGISGDFDGGGGVEGFRDVSDFPKISSALIAAGYTAQDVAKVMGGNALRVLARAQALADPAAVPAVQVTR